MPVLLQIATYKNVGLLDGRRLVLKHPLSKRQPGQIGVLQRCLAPKVFDARQQAASVPAGSDVEISLVQEALHFLLCFGGGGGHLVQVWLLMISFSALQLLPS